MNLVYSHVLASTNTNQNVYNVMLGLKLYNNNNGNNMGVISVKGKHNTKNLYITCSYKIIG